MLPATPFLALFVVSPMLRVRALKLVRYIHEEVKRKAGWVNCFVLVAFGGRIALAIGGAVAAGCPIVYDRIDGTTSIGGQIHAKGTQCAVAALDEVVGPGESL